jgi:hypothetical protein
MNNILFTIGGHDLSLLTTIVILIPVLAMVINRKMWDKSFLALSASIFLLLLSSLTNKGLIDISLSTKYTLNTLSALLQPPFILLFLLYFAQHEQMKKTMKLSVVFLLITGVLILTRKEIQDAAAPVLLGIGLVLVLIYSSIFFIHQVKANVSQRAETGKTFIISGIVFGYFCYSFIFTIHYIFQSNNTEDLITLFEIGTFISALLIVLGVLLNKPIPQEKPVIAKEKIPNLTEWEEFTSYK